MTECVKITYDPHTEELNVEKVPAPDPGVPPSKTITIETGEWEFEDAEYQGAPLSVVQTEGADVGGAALSLSLPNRYTIEEGRVSRVLGVGIGCMRPSGADEIDAFGRWTGWVTADVSSVHDIGEVLRDARNDADIPGVVGRWIGVPHPYEDESPNIAPSNTTIVVRLYERWPPPPSVGDFWTDLQGCREVSI